MSANTTGRLLAALKADTGRFVSGSVLGTALGISRTAVWKQVKKLQAEGYGIESYPHKGYRLVHGPNQLNAREVTDRLTGRWLGHPLVVLDETESTNRVVMQDTDLGHGAVVAARRQTAGRGRLGRVWQGPAGTLCFSLLLSTPLPPHQGQLITLVTAVGLVDGVAAATGIELDIKWPNDLLYHGRKVAGILTEVRSDPDRIVRAVVGIGLNANTAAADFDPEVRDRATSLAQILGAELPPDELLAHLLAGLEAAYDLLLAAPDKAGISGLMERYRHACVTIGKPGTVYNASEVYQGTALAVDDAGALTVQRHNGRREQVYSGDVSLSGSAVPEATR